MTSLSELEARHRTSPRALARRGPRRDSWRAHRRETAVLAALAALAAAVYGWQAAHAEYHGFYATAVRSMTMSWRAFVFGALDPGASITIDKIPGFLWPQAASAKLFGFHPWALALPQVLEGVTSVVVLQRTVRRWAGPTAGLLAAAILTVTPVAASLFGKTLEDAALTCALILAAYFWQRAVESGRVRMLILCGVCVGLGFQAKMLQAWTVLPAFAGVYLLAAPPRLRKRIAHVLAAGAVCLAVSLSWVTAASLTPAADRPYIDGSTTNSAVAMVFGYNGLARFSSVGLNAAGTGSVSASQGAMGHGRGADLTGWAKLLRPGLASQVGWLYPLAALGCALGLARRRRARTDMIRAGTLMWTGCFAVTALALSAGNVAHSTYVVALAPPIAALSALALVRAFAAFRAPLAASRAGRFRAALLPASVLAGGLWAVRLAWAYPSFAGGMALPFAAVVAVAATALLLARFAVTTSARATAACCAAACAVLLAQPTVWSLSVLDSRYDGNSGNASAGAYQGGIGFMHAGSDPAGYLHGMSLEGFHGFSSAMNAFDPSEVLSSAQTRLLDYVTEHRDGAKYLLATQSWSTASPYILTDGSPVLPMGGFSGRADFPTPHEFHGWVRAGAVHYVLLVGGRFGPGAAWPGMVLSPSTTASAATAPPQSASRDDAPGSATASNGPPTDAQRIAAAVKKHCALVPAADYGGVPIVTAPLYACGMTRPASRT